jgi:RNA polymerase sigma-70 factor (ECF subfamily)
MASRRQTKSPGPRDLLFEQQLARARGGCDEALGDLLQGCRRYLLSVATKTLESTLRPKVGASDLVQESFVVAQRDFQAFEGTTLGELLSWLHRILDHRLSDHVRHYKRTSKRAIQREVPFNAERHDAGLALADRQANPGDAATLADEQRRVRLAIEQLPEDYRLVLELRTWQRLPFAEIGQQLARTPGAAEKLWLRAVERLEVELKAIR